MQKLRQPATTMLEAGVHEVFHEAARIDDGGDSAGYTILKKLRYKVAHQRTLLCHKMWIEQWIVKRLEGLKGRGGFRRPDQNSDAGPFARDTVAICAVADE